MTSSTPSTFATIFRSSAVTIAVDPHTAYGPGLKGFGQTLRRQPPPGRHRRVLRHLCHPLHHPRGSPLPPHAQRHIPPAPPPRHLPHRHRPAATTAIACPTTAPSSPIPSPAEISNLYVPGIESDGPSTAKRILIGYALDPVNKSSPSSSPTSQNMSTSASSSSSRSSTRSPSPHLQSRSITTKKHPTWNQLKSCAPTQPTQSPFNANSRRSLHPP